MSPETSTCAQRPAQFVPDPAAAAAMRSSRPPGHGAVPAYDWVAHHRAPTGPPRRRCASCRRARSVSAMPSSMPGPMRWPRTCSSLGIGRGDRVALLAHNGVEYFDLQFACGRTGASPCC